MFDEENQELGLSTMHSLGFPSGRLLYPTPDYPNAMVSTTEDGDFWQGDLEIGDMAKLHEVAKVMGKSLIVASQTNAGYGFTVAA